MAKAEYIQRGDNIDYTATANVAYMEIVPLVSRIGVALAEIPEGETGTLTIVGAFRLPALTEKLDVGQAVYWDKTQNAVTGTSGANTVLAGTVIAAKEQAGTLALVRIG